MTGQISLAGGRFVKVGGKTGIVFQKPPEAEAFSRWQKHQFKEIERRYAQAWRAALSNLNLSEVAKGFRALGVDAKSCRTLEDAKAMAERVVCSRDNPRQTMKLAFLFIKVPQQLHQPVLDCWGSFSYRPLVEHAPYAAYVLTVEIFFQIALAARLISSERPSNRVDIAYLFYLPFCMIFVSSDRLHRRCAPLFQRGDQEFVWGQHLKEGLRELNGYYSKLPDSTKEKGVMSFAHHPPKEGDFLVGQLWDRHLPQWREMKEPDPSHKSGDDSKLIEEINTMVEAPPLAPDEVDFDPTCADSISTEHSVRKRKGSWYQLPKDLEAPPGQ